MISILTIIFFCFGLIIGSFLNVVILRFNTERSLGGRSACMSCSNKLSWYELIPLFSFLGLGGRCRNCKTKISIQYPIVECLTGIIFALLFLKFQNIFIFGSILVFSAVYAYYAVMFALLVVIAVYDVKHKIIPDVLSLVFGVLAFLGMFFFSSGTYFGSTGFTPHWPSLLNLFSGVIIALPFATLWLVSKGAWIGLGDGKLALGLGWFLGFYLAITAVMIAFWVGAIIGVGLIIFSSKKYGLKSEIPFAVYLVLGTLLVFFCNIQLFSSIF